MKSQFREFGLEVTHNSCGYMHQLSKISLDFIEFSKFKPSRAMLDIGAAYGVATIPCLENGARVIANDIDEQHLLELEKRTEYKYSNLLTLKCGEFPDSLEFQDEELSAILISHVLSFLSISELIAGFAKLNRWLCKGGKLFVVNYTPYHKTIEKFIPVYHEILKGNPLFAGFIADKHIYSNKELISNAVPSKLMLLDYVTLDYLLRSNNFDIEYLDYMGGQQSGVPIPFCLDGREFIGCVAIKK